MYWQACGVDTTLDGQACLVSPDIWVSVSAPTAHRSGINVATSVDEVYVKELIAYSATAADRGTPMN